MSLGGPTLFKEEEEEEIILDIHYQNKFVEVSLDEGEVKSLMLARLERGTEEKFGLHQISKWKREVVFTSTCM